MSYEVNKLLKWARYRAKLQNIEFTITKDDLDIVDHCPILGLKLQQNPLFAGPNSPSIDRKNNKIGYIPGNVWIISTLANVMKNSADKEQLILFANWVLRQSPLTSEP